ncbi:MAG: LodA/GoxA family CTQ-dependent oxidase, partial [Pseudomonadota bacterium]
MDDQKPGTAQTTFKIHPSIGIARLGNSDEYYIAPEQPAARPIECDCERNGIELQDCDNSPARVKHFKEEHDVSRVKRQAARFRIFAYREVGQADSEEEIKIGGSYQFEITSNINAPAVVQGTVTDINWTVHLANKKSSWYEFRETDGMHGYPASHPL